MDDYDIVLCADGHYRRVVYGFGPYIADYPEQVLLACTVQGWCPKYVLVEVSHVSSGAVLTLYVFCRCMAPPDDLDTGQYSRRSHELTAAYIDLGLTTRKLWDDHGIISYLTVCVHVLSTHA